MISLTTRLKKLTTPEHLTQADGIAFWKEKVLLNILLAATLFGLVAYIPSVTLSIVEGLWPIVVIDTLLYLTIIYLFINKKLSYQVRALCFPVAAYVLGIILITALGPFGAGSVWLFSFPVLTGVLFEHKAAIRALAVNVLTLIGIGVLIYLDSSELLMSMNLTNSAWLTTSVNPLGKWVVISVNFMLLNILTTLSLATLLNGLQKSARQTLESQRKYKHIFENIQDIYFESSLDGTILEISPSVKKITGYSRDTLKNQSLIDFYSDPAQHDKLLKQLVRQGAVKEFELAFKSKLYPSFFCSINARIENNKKDEQTKIIGSLRDITHQKEMEEERKSLEEKLNRASKMEAIGLLAGGVAHDLNNILSGIVTYPELLAIDLAKDDPMRKSLEIIQSSGNRASRIVQDLLTLSRRSVVIKEVINLNEVAKQFLDTPEYKKMLSFNPGITVVQHINALKPNLKGSPIHLQKTLMNLVSNAAEAQKEGGKIIITTENRYLDTPIKGYDKVEPGEYVVLSVKDLGSGISPEDLKRIFEPFFTKKVMGRSGTGLGMAVVWGTVQDHDGYIDIITYPDRGTVFELYFPICEDQPERASDVISIDMLKGNQEKILIIDDVPEQRQIAASIVEKLGYIPVTVESGEKAIQYLKENDADLLLLDMIMEPGIDGYETYRRTLKFKPQQKAIIASGFSRSAQVTKALDLGAGQYLKKPYTIEGLGTALKEELTKI